MNLTCFKAYDVRGKLGDELNVDIAYRIGLAFATFLKAETIVVGGDVRATSAELKAAFSNGARDFGTNVIDIGTCGTEEIYFATSHLKVDGGCVITASHNPIDYNGMKMVKANSEPISSDNGLNTIKKLAEENRGFFSSGVKRGNLNSTSVLDAYVQHLLTYIDTKNITPLRILVNAGNGAAGHVIDALEKHLPFDFFRINHEPDPTFPNGIPNPLLKENQPVTSSAVLQYGADFGVAWDGDFDRCFFFDEKGNFIEGYYIVGLLAESFLSKFPGEKIIYDPRLTWNTETVVKEAGGISVKSRTGHAFFKDMMRIENAVYGGEMSAHHYFRDFYFCDSGMIPWLLVAEIISSSGKSIGTLVAESIKRYPSSGEINSHVADPKSAINRVLEFYSDSECNIDYTDGISVDFSDWRFNLRLSNTEPVVRLNVESRGDHELMQLKTVEVLGVLKGA